MKNLSDLVTEGRNERTREIDSVSTLEMLRIINREDSRVADAVAGELESIARAVDEIYERVRHSGRLIYCGAGTSGRLGILDASECPPTYNVSENLVVGLIAGGREAMFHAVEGAEDDETLCEKDLRALGFNERDALVGIAASGRTPYVLGGLRYARSLGALTIAVTCNADSAMKKHADITIAPVVGPEVISGSTRMKAGTAQKMVLNMLSTGLMIRSGKVYGNLMVDLQPSNEKLMVRAGRIITEATGVDEARAQEMLALCDNEVKTAIVAIQTGLTPELAREILTRNEGRIEKTIQSFARERSR